MPRRQLQLLKVFVSRPNEVIGKTELIEATWEKTAVADNTLSKSVSRVRDTITVAGSPCTIMVEHGQGYRLTGAVERIATPRREAGLEALLAPHRAFVEGRAALETLKRDRLEAAGQVFTALAAEQPNNATMHVGLANACVLAFEATRAGATPDIDALRTAAIHAREACALKPDYAEAWATLGFVLERTGERADAVAALTRAVALEPQNWRHQLRLSYGSWGEQRLTAARQTLALLPACPMAHLLAATVFVARGRLVEAEREVDAALALGRAAGTVAPLSTVALHWLKGLLLLARGREAEASDAFQRELALEDSGHLYARECSANAWYALGVCRLRSGDRLAAHAAFEQAIARVPRHPMAHAGIALVTGTAAPDIANTAQATVDVALARAGVYVAAGEVANAVQCVSTALAAAPPGNAGWLLPIEPLLNVRLHPPAWATELATLCARAS